MITRTSNTIRRAAVAMDRISFTVNGKKCSVGAEVDADVSLNDYIRNTMNLRGTKYMCKEGGCGACIVAVTTTDHFGHSKTFAVNSCLVHIASCEDWAVTTIEGIGGRVGYHPIQKTLAEYNGSQCGYCSPGWVMSMYSLLEANNYNLTTYEIEKSFGSNTCRCTGYRPILDAFKSFGKVKTNVTDIEDLNICKEQQNCKQKCDESWCIVTNRDVESKVKKVNFKDGYVWYKVYGIDDVFDVLKSEGTKSYMLINGNTGKGIFPMITLPRVLIDISSVDELKTHYFDQNLTIGAGKTIADVMTLFKDISKEREEFSYLNKMYEHLDQVAHVPVRNIGTVGGNLMLKNKHPSFTSDIFLLFETVGATVTVQTIRQCVEMGLPQFLSTDMSGKLLVNIKLPPLSQNHQFVCYKVMPRSQNAPVKVNAGFLYELDIADKDTLHSATIVIGGVSEGLNHAVETEKFLVGTKLFTNETLQSAIKILEKELTTKGTKGIYKQEYIKKCALGLFYKSLLTLIPTDKLKSSYCSGARDLRKSRPVSKGSEVYDTNPILWPVNEPMPKLESLIQCSGEATYCNDVPTQPNEVYCAFVTANVCVGRIENIDASAALKIPGVLAFYTAKHIPGKNSFLPKKVPGIFVSEEILSEDNIKYYNQPIGIIVTETEKLANRAAILVQVNYKDVKAKPILTISDAKEREPNRITLLLFYPARGRGFNVKKVIKGTQRTSWQYHYHMETQSCVTKSSEDGIDVYPTSQWPNQIHVAISQVLKMEQNRINIKINRCGGSYGAKITRNGLISCACALVTYLTGRPCRFVMSMEANMRIIGKRLPCTLEYEMGVDSAGEIQYMKYDFYENHGYIVSDAVTLFGIAAIKNCYNNTRWQYKIFSVTTDTASNTYARSPGALETIAVTEHLMERISYELSLDPLQVRLKNLDPLLTDVADIVQTLIKECEYNKRREQTIKFNQENRWKKRGLRLAMMSWPAGLIMDYHISLTVYHGDATVVIHHGGIEVGQGINTKVAQAVAYTLKISLSKVKVKPYNVSSSPNSSTTGNSRTTQSICFGAIKCCQLLIDRLSTIRDTLNDPTWEILIQAAFSAGINLQTSYQVTSNDEEVHRSAGAAVAEVELDILTGEHDILRVDIIEDVGLSLNPEIDIGQIEGAFVMGIGYWTCERLVYDEETGELLTNRSWNYHVPLARDIPIDFRVKLRRNSHNPIGTLGAKGVGEPPICLAVSVAFALREAIAASRTDSGHPTNEWFDVDGPYTLEENVLKSDVGLNEYLFY